MRGKPSGGDLPPHAPRITPAGAGKTTHRGLMTVKFKDHPRRCGENMECTCWRLAGMGSPPQVRGKLCYNQNMKYDIRITPAGAGKTRQPPLNSRSRWDHPRRCGENIFGRGVITHSAGSPPQVRGKRLFSYLRSPRLGITPAGAGKTNVFNI